MHSTVYTIAGGGGGGGVAGGNEELDVKILLAPLEDNTIILDPHLPPHAPTCNNKAHT